MDDRGVDALRISRSRLDDPEAQSAHASSRALIDEVSGIVSGGQRAARLAVTCVLAGGNLLIEDVPGVGKTTLALSLAAAAGLTTRRIQFTPDLMPSDVTGVSIYNAASGEFEFRPGPVFANILVADEINRASPKTQSALLEAMQERAVTVDGATRRLPRPFMVVATQNPVDMEGTYPLPEAQRDRFAMSISLGYPSLGDEVAMLEASDGGDPIDQVRPVIGPHDLESAIAAAGRVYSTPGLKRYVAELIRRTRDYREVTLGASPRAAVQLLRAAKAAALVDGRGYVVADDVQDLAPRVLAHRLTLERSVSTSVTPEDIVADAIGSVRVPRNDREANRR